MHSAFEVPESLGLESFFHGAINAAINTNLFRKAGTGAHSGLIAPMSFSRLSAINSLSERRDLV